MESRDSKRKKDKDSENREYKNNDKKPKKRRSRSRTPKENRHGRTKQKRKYSKSPSPSDAKYGKRKNDKSSESQNQPEAPIRKIKETDMLNTKTGGAYIPPARLRMMQAQITDKSSVAYQRLAWEALKKSIHGHINKINVGNIGIIIKELLKENIVRGRGLLCRSVIQAQAASPTFTNVYAALAGAINSRFPNIGELLLKRLVIQFKRGFKRNDKPICISSASFIAHLVNQKVAHEILALELLTLLVETPTDDSVEVAIAFLKECGQKLTEVSSKGINAIFEMLRNILHEGQLDKRVQYMIEVMFQVWKDGFKDHPAVIEELELVPEEEQFTHLLMLDDATDSQDILNVFKFDDKYEENEQKYKTLCKEILGSDAESGEEDGSEGSGSEESDDNEDEEGENKEMTIIDKTETNLVALRRTIYLTINSSLDFEECAHKLMKMQLKPGQEIELCHMFLDCCAEQRTYEKFYGLLAQRFCNINRIYIGPFEEIFKDSYATAHRLDTNRLRNVSKFFAHLLFTDSISWEVLECVKLNEEDTTSSSRIYIKILFQELAEYMGLKKLNERLKDPTLQQAFSGVFPRDNPRNTRFSINFFTSIGLGGLTDELREHLKQMPKNVPSPITEININSESSSTSSSSSSDDSSTSDSSSSDSEDEKQKNGKKINNKKKKSKKQKTPDPEEPTQKDITSERWGHDGFYDTYGLGARRAVPNSSEGERSNVRKSAREIERDKRNYDYINGDERGKRDRRTERRESRDDIEAFKKYRENPSRRKGNEDGDERRRNGNGEKRTRRDNENENKVIRDVDEKSHRRDKENESRPRRINEDDRKYRRYNEDERGQRRDYSDERRQKRDNANERTQKRQSDDEIKQRRDCEDESKRKRNSEGVKKQRNDSNDKVSRTRENEYDNRHKNDNEDVRRRRKEKENVSNHKSDKEKGTGRKRDGGDQERNEKNLKSKDKIYIDRNNGRSNKKESRNKKDEEKKCGIKDKEKSVRNKPKNRKKRDSERRAKEKVKKRAETESDTDSDSGTDSSSDSSSSSSNDSSSDSDLDDSKHFKKPKEYKKKENLGGRYWDTFDIDSGRGTEEEREKIN